VDILLWLQGWYAKHCDGYWEHLYGIKIGNVDNPGWSLSIDLTDTELESKDFNKIQYDNSDEDWMICRVENNCFEGRGGVKKLEEILIIFKNWSES
jgi:hypothetical protein